MRIASNTGKAKDGHYPLVSDSDEGKDYIHDLEFALQFALFNRKTILSRVEKSMRDCCDGSCDWGSLINRNHNHAEFKDGMWIHRKGATHAEAGMMGVIPGNMRDGSFIVEGKGNPDSLWSSSHGAGRVLGRRQAKETLAMEDFKNAMEGITAKVVQSTIDESPMAYKDIFEVMDNQKELVEVKHRVVPLINIKA